MQRLSRPLHPITFGLLISVAGLSQARAAETYEIDAAHSTVIFKVRHLGVSNAYGRFNDFSGTIVADAGHPEKSSVEVTIKADSVDTANEKRDKHLRNQDFFNTKQFPVIIFKSTKVEKTGDKTGKATGDLFLHGVTRTVTVDLTFIGSGKDPWGGHRAGFEAAFAIKRSDYGMKYLLEGVGDEVHIIVSLEGTRK